MIFVVSSGFQWICAVITVISIRNSVQPERPNTEKDIPEAVCVGGQEETRWEARKSVGDRGSDWSRELWLYANLDNLGRFLQLSSEV